jgi:hypothetical protein
MTHVCLINDLGLKVGNMAGRFIGAYSLTCLLKRLGRDFKNNLFI